MTENIAVVDKICEILKVLTDNITCDRLIIIDKIDARLAVDRLSAVQAP